MIDQIPGLRKGGGPPADVPASDLFLELQARPRPSEVVPFPGTDKEVRIQVLRKEDHDRARLTATKVLERNASRYGIGKLTPELMATANVREVLGDITACELLAVACLTPNPQAGSTEESPIYGRIFPDGESVGKVVGADEIAVLFATYLAIQHKYGPFEAFVPDVEDCNAWVKRLVEGAAHYPFAHIALPQWAELLACQAARLYSLSQILESQWSSLPESLQSSLQSYCLGTTSSGEPLENSGETPSGELEPQRIQDIAKNFRGGTVLE